MLLQERCEDPPGPLRQLRELPESIARDKDRLLPLVIEPVNDSSSVLIFCASRAQTQSTATFIAQHLSEFLRKPWPAKTMSKRQTLVEELLSKLGTTENKLQQLIMQGESQRWAASGTSCRRNRPNHCTISYMRDAPDVFVEHSEHVDARPSN